MASVVNYNKLSPPARSGDTSRFMIPDVYIVWGKGILSIPGKEVGVEEG